jgi:hypothetical protein
LERLLSAPTGHELFNPATDCGDLLPKVKALKAAMTGANADAAGALAALAGLRRRCDRIG